MSRKLRKQQNLLVDAGMGVILFAIWSVVQVNLYLGLSSFSVEEFRKAAESIGLGMLELDFFIIFITVILVAILLWQLGIRLYIGLCATAEGKGTKKGWAYLVLAAMLLVINLRSSFQIFIVDRLLAGEKLSVNLVTCICMEAASLYVLLELLISGIRVKMLRKKMKE